MGETVYFMSILKALHTICRGDGAFAYASNHEELMSLPEVQAIHRKYGTNEKRSPGRHLLSSNSSSSLLLFLLEPLLLVTWLP